MAKKQKIILNNLAKKHNISIGQAEEIFGLFVDKIATTISEEDKMEDGLYVADRFKTIHMDNFGKFIPNLNKIAYANKYLEKKKNGH